MTKPVTQPKTTTTVAPITLDLNHLIDGSENEELEQEETVLMNISMFETGGDTLPPSNSCQINSAFTPGPSRPERSPLDSDRIIGGVAAEKQNWPFITLLKFYPSGQCGGSIINDQWILTAAHCCESRLKGKHKTDHYSTDEEYK